MASAERPRPMPPPDDAVYRRLVELAPDAMIGVDEAGSIVLVNSQAEQLFGYSRTELIGQPVELLVPVNARDRHPAHRRSYLRDPVLRPMGLGLQLAGRRRDGSEFPAEISLGAIETADGWIVSAAIRDVSERLAAEREREQLARQAAADRAERTALQSQRLESLGQLAGGVAHDFNNLLAVISNYAAFVRETIEAADQPDEGNWATARRDIGQIERAAEAAARLTRQLLTFARRDVVRMQPVDLNVVVAETVDLLQRTLGADVQLVVDTAAELPAINADPGQIQQVLVNVALNSRHAMPHGGSLSIVTRDDRSRGTVHLVVEDNGIGMDEATLARAFEPFFTTRAGDHGSGLGLATVYGIVAQVGGTVVLTSRPGRGTTFTASFPAVEGIRHGALDDPVTPEVARTATLLVVDDEPSILDIAERILTRHGYRVLTAGAPDDAEHLARTHPDIELLLSDVIMPQLNGPDLAARIQELLPGLPVVFISGYSDLATRLSIGDDAITVEKPFTSAQLLDAVERALLGR